MTPVDFPANSSGFTSIVAGEAVSLAMLNAVARQQLDGTLAQAVTAMGVSEILSIAPAEAAAKTASARALSGSSAALPDAFVLDLEPTGSAPGTAAGSKAPHGATETAADLIALAVALSVQDAANYLRNVQTLNVAALAANYIDRSSSKAAAEASDTIAAATAAMDHGRAQFEKLCQQSVETLKQLRSAHVAEPDAETAPLAGSSSHHDILQATISALSVAVKNAVNNQQQVNVTAQASTTMGVSTLYALDTAATGVAVKDILGDAKHGVSKVPASVAD